MFLSTFSMLNAALAILLCFEDAAATPTNNTVLYSPIKVASRGAMSNGIHTSANRTAMPINLPHHNGPATNSFAKRGATGDLEAHWQFVLEETVCGDYGEVCFSPQASLWVDYYADGASSPTCSTYWDITEASTSNQLNGHQYFSPNCDFTVIFDSNGSGGTVETYGAGYGVNCGWVSSWDHTSYQGGLWLTDDYYFHCMWSY